jgi:mannose-6-phosphate isomerase-like protein (cupin superfamily)
MRLTYGSGVFSAAPARPPMRARVEALQAELAKLPQFEPETRHYFHAGMYCREVFRPAGVLVVGKVHKQEHFYVVASGTVAVTTDDGMQEITGPAVLLSRPGTKRAVLALTDATCLTFHVTQAKTPEAAEHELVEPDELSPFGIGNQLKQEVLS